MAGRDRELNADKLRASPRGSRDLGAAHATLYARALRHSVWATNYRNQRRACCVAVGIATGTAMSPPHHSPIAVQARGAERSSALYCRRTTADCAREGRITCLSSWMDVGCRVEGNCHSKWRCPASRHTAALRTCTCFPRPERSSADWYLLHMRAEHSHVRAPSKYLSTDVDRR